jgi:hypothetical protein
VGLDDRSTWGTWACCIWWSLYCSWAWCILWSLWVLWSLDCFLVLWAQMIGFPWSLLLGKEVFWVLGLYRDWKLAFWSCKLRRQVYHCLSACYFIFCVLSDSFLKQVFILSWVTHMFTSILYTNLAFGITNLDGRFLPWLMMISSVSRRLRTAQLE